MIRSGPAGKGRRLIDSGTFFLYQISTNSQLHEPREEHLFPSLHSRCSLRFRPFIRRMLIGRHQSLESPSSINCPLRALLLSRPSSSHTILMFPSISAFQKGSAYQNYLLFYVSSLSSPIKVRSEKLRCWLRMRQRVQIARR